MSLFFLIKITISFKTHVNNRNIEGPLCQNWVTLQIEKRERLVSQIWKLFILFN